jgi:hypothetical protein
MKYLTALALGFVAGLAAMRYAVHVQVERLRNNNPFLSLLADQANKDGSLVPAPMFADMVADMVERMKQRAAGDESNPDPEER